MTQQAIDAKVLEKKCNNNVCLQASLLNMSSC